MEVGGGEVVAERSGAGMMRRDGCLKFGKRWGLKVCTIEDLVDFVEKEGEREATLGRNG